MLTARFGGRQALTIPYSRSHAPAWECIPTDSGQAGMTSGEFPHLAFLIPHLRDSRLKHAGMTAI